VNPQLDGAVAVGLAPVSMVSDTKPLQSKGSGRDSLPVARSNDRQQSGEASARAVLEASWRACCILYGFAAQSLSGGSVETLSWLSKKWERLVAALASRGLAGERDATVFELCRASLPVWRPQAVAAQAAAQIIRSMGARPFSSHPILVPTSSGLVSSRLARTGGGVLLPSSPVQRRERGATSDSQGNGWSDGPPPVSSDSRLLGTRHVACLRSLLLLAHGTGEALQLGSWLLVCDSTRCAAQLLAHAGVELPIVPPRRSVLDQFHA